jgi:hypothetical protein
MKIIIDSDGFFWPDNIESEYMRVQRELISFVNEQHSLDNLFEQYYLGFRSAMFICEDTVENESEAREALQKYCEGCIQSAMRYMKNHIELKPPLPVDFMWIVREAIADELKEEFPEVGNIKLRLSMKPRLSARTADKNTIIFPALTRSVLIHCNLVIINSVFRTINEDGQLVGDIDRKQIARFIFPYLLYCHDDFSVRNLPIIGAHSQDAIQTAFQFTNLQLIFIFAHEYAHILLQHFDDNKVIFTKENIEDEADAFALKVVLAYGEKSGSYSKLDILAAIRWLFKYQLIEESIGALIREKPIEFSASNFEERRGKFQSELLENHGLNGSSLFESIGFCMIVELQDVLYEFGSKLVNNIIDIFHESKKTGGIEPWWEKIT